jgi:hypothetical protein
MQAHAGQGKEGACRRGGVQEADQVTVPSIPSTLGTLGDFLSRAGIFIRDVSPWLRRTRKTANLIFHATS